MKKKFFTVAIVLLAVVGIAHTAWCYFHIANEAFTSFPAEVAFLLLIPYALAIAVCLIAGLLICRKKR